MPSAGKSLVRRFSRRVSFHAGVRPREMMLGAVIIFLSDVLDLLMHTDLFRLLSCCAVPLPVHSSKRRFANVQFSMRCINRVWFLTNTLRRARSPAKPPNLIGRSFLQLVGLLASRSSFLFFAIKCLRDRYLLWQVPPRSAWAAACSPTN